MAILLLSVLVVSSLLAVTAQERFPQTPLVLKRFSYPTGLPYQADSENLLRGTQFGYNRLSDRGYRRRGSRLVLSTRARNAAYPPDALKGVQFMRTPDYVQVVGFIDQTAINIAAGDSGGELDPHGADLRGNPLGGLMYSNAWSKSADTYVQVIEWHNFMGGNAFCLKVCDPSRPNAASYCQHRYDRIGCAYNAPNNAKEGVFESCEGENQDFPGVYTQDGRVLTYTQPPEALGTITLSLINPVFPPAVTASNFRAAPYTQIHLAVLRPFH
ncbi:macrophage activating glycoprotein [Salix suchowensis]|nr:macrophage activating glycoprotein [Salix suchowensis]